MNPPNVPGPSSLPGNEPGNLPPTPNVPPSSSVPPPSKPSGGGLFSGRNIIIGLIALLALCVCGCGAVFVLTGGAIANVFSQVAAPSATGVEFLTDLSANDYTKAYALCTPALQRTLGSPAALGKRISDASAVPSSWSLSNANLNNDRWELSGTAVFSGGRPGTVSLIVVKVSNEWKVDAFNLTPQ